MYWIQFEIRHFVLRGYVKVSPNDSESPFLLLCCSRHFTVVAIASFSASFRGCIKCTNVPMELDDGFDPRSQGSSLIYCTCNPTVLSCFIFFAKSTKFCWKNELQCVLLLNTTCFLKCSPRTNIIAQEVQSSCPWLLAGFPSRLKCLSV